LRFAGVFSCSYALAIWYGSLKVADGDYSGKHFRDDAPHCDSTAMINASERVVLNVYIVSNDR
jgi:hypothetical protein